MSKSDTSKTPGKTRKSIINPLILESAIEGEVKAQICLTDWGTQSDNGESYQQSDLRLISEWHCICDVFGVDKPPADLI